MSFILLVVFVSLLGTMLLQLGMRLFVAAFLTATGAAGVLPALALCLLAALGWGGLQAWLWPRVVDDEEWRPWLARLLAATGTLTIMVSLHHFWFSGAHYSGTFLVLCHLQLLATFAWVLMAARLPAEEVEVPPVGASVGRILSFTTVGGLLAYALPLTNVARLYWGVSPEASPTWYLQGCALGTLLGVVTAPMAAGARVPVLVAAGVGLGVTNPYLAVLLQLGLSALTLLPGRSGGEALAAAWRLTLGMTAGRILGRALGALLVGQEGVAVLEPLAENVVGVLSLRRK